jgi:hypothetical protein
MSAGSGMAARVPAGVSPWVPPGVSSVLASAVCVVRDHHESSRFFSAVWQDGG